MSNRDVLDGLVGLVMTTMFYMSALRHFGIEGVIVIAVVYALCSVAVILSATGKLFFALFLGAVLGIVSPVMVFFSMAIGFEYMRNAMEGIHE